MPNFDDPLGVFGPIIRWYIPDEDTDVDEDRQRDGGDFDEDEYGPYFDKLAA